MGETHLSDGTERGALAMKDGGGGPLSNAIHGQDGGLLKRRWEKGGRPMGFMMLDEEEPTTILAPECPAHFARKMELFMDPGRQCRPKQG
jgi:hypothetical protein